MCLPPFHGERICSANHLCARWVTPFAKLTAYWQCMKTFDNVCKISAGFLVVQILAYVCWFSVVSLTEYVKCMYGQSLSLRPTNCLPSFSHMLTFQRLSVHSLRINNKCIDPFWSSSFCVSSMPRRTTLPSVWQNLGRYMYSKIPIQNLFMTSV